VVSLCFHKAFVDNYLESEQEKVVKKCKKSVALVDIKSYIYYRRNIDILI